jgi:hypothetical protein
MCRVSVITTKYRERESGLRWESQETDKNEEAGRPMGLGKGLKEDKGSKREGKEVRCKEWRS